MNKLLSRLIPFLFLGIMVVIFIIGIVIFSYILLIGAAVGLIFFAIAWIRAKLFQSKLSSKPTTKTKPGRTIDHDDSNR